mgnify:FL=1
MLRDTNYVAWNKYVINNYIPLNYLIGHDLDQIVDYRSEGYNHSLYTNRMKNLLSPVSLELTPYNTQVQAGGVLNFDLVRHNWESTTQVYWIKLSLEQPGGGFANLYKTPRKLTMPGNQVHTKNLNYTMPAGTPIGIYTMKCLIGLPPADLWYLETFDVEVIP